MTKNDRMKWANAIALRISDEWEGSLSFPEDAALLQSHIEKSLFNNGKAIKSFIETGIIESDYFENI